MSKYLDKLNKAQRKAAMNIKGPLAIIAGAGSGKTRTIAHKISHLIEGIGINPKRLLALTFTNKAAEEMRERLVSMIGEKAKATTTTTFHSVCARILKIEHKLAGLPQNFNILDNIDQRAILSPIYKKYELSPKTHSYNSTISYISKNKMTGNSPDYLVDKSVSDSDKIIANIYKDYQETIKRIKSVDFDDLLILTLKLFNNHNDCSKKWSNKYDYVLVDEFQDTSLVQYEIVKHLAQHNNITIVGDPDQTIYTWRQAHVELINNFKKYFKGAKIVKLEENYRSTQNILKAANKLISYNKKRIEKNLFTSREEGGVIDFNHAFSDDSEARYIVQTINRLRKERTQLKDVAILYRANYQSNALERALINENLNYVIYGGVKFYQRQEVKDALAYLKIISSNDEVSMRRMINIPSRKIGRVAQGKIIEFANSYGLSTFDAIMKHFTKVPVTKLSRDNLARYINLINKYKKAIASNKVSVVLDKFLIEVGYYSIWNPVTDQTRIDNVRQLVKTIADWESQNEAKTIHDYLEEISLYTERTDHSYGADFVSLMTVHSAKGLEFDNVFLAGFSDGIFPSNRSMDEGGKDALEEERRLAYVAITRAKNRLYISDARGYSIDHRFQKRPSRFLSEMGINIRAYTKEFIAPKDKKDNYTTKNKDILAGDKVSHVSFGEGVVVNVQGDLIDISFKKPHGVKTLMKTHKSIERVG